MAPGVSIKAGAGHDWTLASLPTLFVFEFVDVADAKLDQLRAQSVEVQTQLAGAKTFTSLQLFGSSFGAEPGNFGGGFPLHNHNTVSISNNEFSRAYDRPGANDWHIH